MSTWKNVEALFYQAIEADDPERVLENHPQALADDVRSLLEASKRCDTFLETPPEFTVIQCVYGA